MESAWVVQTLASAPELSKHALFVTHAWLSANKMPNFEKQSSKLQSWLVKTCAESPRRFLPSHLLVIRQLLASPNKVKAIPFPHVSRRLGRSRSKSSQAKNDMMEYIDSLDPRKRMPKYKPEIKCNKCGLDTYVIPLTVQTRRGDEMQSVNYECSNHKPRPHKWTE